MATLVRESKNSKAASIRADGDRRRRYTYATILMESGKSGSGRREGCRMNAKRGVYMVFMGRANGSKRARCEVYSMRRPVDLKKTSSNKQEHDGQAYA